MDIKHILTEAAAPADKTALRRKLASLQADLRDMNVTPGSESEADAIDDVKDEIAKVKKALRELNDVSETSGEDAVALYDKHLAKVNGLMDRVKKALEQHKQVQNENPSSYGHACDLSQVAYELENILDFLED